MTRRLWRCFSRGASIVSGSDCNDPDAFVYPSSPGIENDGVDRNYDGFEPCCVDADQDGYGNTAGNVGLSTSDEQVSQGFQQQLTIVTTLMMNDHQMLLRFAMETIMIVMVVLISMIRML